MTAGASSSSPDTESSARRGLSVVLAVKDESAQIRECLRELAFADEIVVVDMHSTDGTLEICREVADKVIVHDGGPHGLIHVNKNLGIDAATGPWILNLDADERLTAELREEILKLLSSTSEPKHTAYRLRFTHFFFGKFLRHGGFSGGLVRLFKKGSCRYPEDRAHSTPEVTGTIGDLSGWVVHFNHPRLSDFVRKMNLYTTSDAALMNVQGHGGLRNRPLPRRLGWKLLTAPLSVFWNRFIRHAGFRDGVHGFVAAVLLAMYQFVEYAKVWELRHVREAEKRS